jgi:hypothetical protein
MTELQRTGFFREMPIGKPSDPSLGEARHPAPSPHEDRIAAYLDAGHVYIATPGYTRDVFDTGRRIGPPHYLTDGRFVWPGDLAHYVRTYHIRLDGSFVEHMMANGWIVPAEVDIATLTLPRRRDDKAGAPADRPDLASAFSNVEPDGATPPPDAALDQYPVPVLIEAFARAAAKQHGFEGTELRRQVSDLTGQVQALVRRLEIKANEEQQRRRTHAEIERLLDTFAQSGTEAGKAIAQHKEAIIEALRELDLGRIAGGLQVLVNWLQDPSSKNSGQVDELIARLTPPRP